MASGLMRQCDMNHTANERLFMSLRPIVQEGMIPPHEQRNDMTNLSVETYELTIDQLDKVTGGDGVKPVVKQPGCQCGGGGGGQNGTGPGTGPGNGHGGVVWAGGDSAGAAGSIA
jgi:hypothetical protein